MTESHGPVYSPDGRYLWTGTEWIPAPPAPPAGPPPTAWPNPPGPTDGAWMPPVAGIHRKGGLGATRIPPWVVVLIVIAALMVGGLVIAGVSQENQKQHDVDCTAQDIFGDQSGFSCPGQ